VQQAQAAGKANTAPTQPDGLESRPAAALGGAAASVAMAQDSAKQTKPAAAASAASASNAPGQQPGNSKSAAAANQAAPTATAAAVPAAAGDKPGGANASAAKSGGGDTAGLSGGQGNTLGGLPGTAASGGSVQQTSFAETLTSARHTAANPAEQIAVQVQRAQVAGQDQINIKLHPAELGRIEVKLENASDGTLRAVISAERPETLDLLQRDARGLERALQEAGVKTDSGSLNFNLRGQGHEQQNANDGGAGRGGI
jgi:flagellar hook-length control protein FliK